MSNISTSGGETGTDTGSDIAWVMSAGTVAQNIAPSATNTMTFDYTYSGGADFGITIETYYDNGTTESAQGVNATENFTTLPVTIAYVYPQETANGLDVDFSTSSETANIGFNIYAVKGKKWTKLNETIIPGALDSFEPRDYHVSLSVPSDFNVKKIGIAGIDGNGKEDRHGPFKVGRESGTKAKAIKVDWKKVKRQVKADRNAKKAAKKAARKAAKAVKLELKDQVIHLDVTEDAVYRVTHDELLDAGINLNGQKAKNIAVSFQGKGVARHIEGLDKRKRWTSDSWLEFEGTAPQGSDALYLDANRYQLSLKKKLVLQTSTIEPSMVKTKIFETNNRYASTIPGDDPFYDGYLYSRGEGSSGTLTRSFMMPKLQEGVSNLKLNLTAYSTQSHAVVVYLNDAQIASETAEGYMDWPIEISVNNNLFVEGSNTLKLVVPGREDVFDYVVYDKLTVTYSYGVVNETLNPAIEATERISRKSLKPKSGTNYVIIAHSLFIGEALERYVQQRESEGWNIKVVDIEDIYTAFGYGMKTPEAIKKYLKMAKRQGVTHVQLVGAATYDYHDYLNTGSMSFIPSMYALTAKTIKYTPCDACLVLNKKDVPALAIGRWPVRTLEDIETVVNKTLAWESTAQSSTKSGLFIADATDKGVNFGQQMEETVQKFVQKGWTELTRVYLDDKITANNGDVETAVSDARSEILSTLSNGASVTSYSGHSSPSQWSFSGLLKESDIASVDNNNRTTLALPLACFATYADSPYINTMAHQLLVEGENGAVAVYGAASVSYFGDNSLASKKVIDGLFKNKTVGESVKEMKQSLGSKYRDIIRSGTLQGDVTLKLK